MADLADCLNEMAPVTPEERATLIALEVEHLSFRRGVEIRAQGDKSNAIFVLKEGCVKSSLALDSGERQIIRLHFPGDLLGAAGLGYREAVDTLHAASDVKLARLDRTALAKLFETHPRLAMLLYLSSQDERVILIDRLCSVGQTSARSRVAALLVTTCARLRLKSDAGGVIKLPFPFTQIEMGQMAGLSAVHVNRVVKSLVQEEIVAWRREVVTVLNTPRLKEVAAIPHHTRDEALAWLPWPKIAQADAA